MGYPMRHERARKREKGRTEEKAGGGAESNDKDAVFS
jgi:hypothetical protein